MEIRFEVSAPQLVNTSGKLMVFSRAAYRIHDKTWHFRLLKTPLSFHPPSNLAMTFS